MAKVNSPMIRRFAIATNRVLENRLIASESLKNVPAAARLREEWSYLPDGRWSQRIVSSWNGSTYVPQTTNRFVWDGQVLLAVLNHTNGLELVFLRGQDLSGTMQGAGGVGGLVAVRVGPALPCGPLTNPIRFSTQYADDVRGTLKYLYREYYPSTGTSFLC